MVKGCFELMLLIQLLTAPDARIFAPSLDIPGYQVLTDKRLIRLTILGFISFSPDVGYRLTPAGEQHIEEVFDRPTIINNAQKWIALVRQGIDAGGHETKVRRAAIPGPEGPPHPEEPPYAEIIDMIDACLNQELDEYVLGINLGGSDATV